jgi:hypothetical protein
MPRTKNKSENPFERYAGADPVTTTRRYAVPLSVIRQIRAVTPMYGSQGRALQVGTEILTRLKRPLKVPSRHDGVTRMTYKLLPRTVVLLDELTEVYGSHASVFCAIRKVLEVE